MINWKEVTIEDRDAVNALVYPSGCHSADYSFAIMYMWRKTYSPLISFADNRLLIAMPAINMYAYPQGVGDVRPAMELLMDEAHSHGHKLMLRGLTDRTLEEFLPLYGDRFDITEDRDNSDYIYTADKLCNLPGRHLASKRNHINRFLKNGDWELRKVTNETGIEDIKRFLDEFYDEKGDADLEAEAEAINEMFENFDALDARAALLYQNGRAFAFSAGTRLDNETFDTHFEKALPDAEGAYAMINREFARMIVDEFPEITLFNREEDMGLEGLRKAKLSYHPDTLLMKYFAREK